MSGQLFCTLCYSNQHNIRNCMKVVCNRCRQEGHQLRDCKQLRSVQTVSVIFAHNETVRAAVTPHSIRNMPSIGMFLRTLPEMPPTIVNENKFDSFGNRIDLKYNERDDIVLSLQDGREETETLIHITPAHIKVSAKYSILNGELYEDTTREATGSRRLPAPPASAYVLLINEAMFRTTVCLEINQIKYYLEWRALHKNSYRYAVVVSSTHNYRARMGPPPRRSIADLAKNFLGPRTDAEPAVATPPPEQIGEENADDRHGNEIAGDIMSNDPVTMAEIDETNSINEQNTDGEVLIQVGVTKAIAANDEQAHTTIAEDAEVNTSDSMASDYRTDDNNTDETSMEMVTVNADAPLSPEISAMMDSQFALPDSRRSDETVSDGEVSVEENRLVIDENP